jgi:hypothetical protein
MRYIKLSVDLLANAITTEQCAYGCGEGYPFVIMAQAKTLEVLREFIKVMKIPDSSARCLWGIPLIGAEEVPTSSILIGCHPSGRETNSEDFVKALRSGLDEKASKPTGKFMDPNSGDRTFEDSGIEVWGRLVDLG